MPGRGGGVGALAGGLTVGVLGRGGGGGALDAGVPVGGSELVD